MCTSHVAGNTQRLVSMGKRRKSEAMVVINAMVRSRKRWHRGYCQGTRLKAWTVVGDDESLAKMRSGSVDIAPYLYSRNTIGHETTTQILKDKNGPKLTGMVAVK